MNNTISLISFLNNHWFRLYNVTTDSFIVTSSNERPDIQYHPEINKITDTSGTVYAVHDQSSNQLDLGMFIAKLFHGQVCARLTVNELLKLNSMYDFIHGNTILQVQYNEQQRTMQINVSEGYALYFTENNKNIYNVDNELILMDGDCNLFQINFISKQQLTLTETQLV